MYKLVSESGKIIGEYETKRIAESVFDDMNGIYEDLDGNEERIYIDVI